MILLPRVVQLLLLPTPVLSPQQRPISVVIGVRGSIAYKRMVTLRHFFFLLFTLTFPFVFVQALTLFSRHIPDLAPLAHKPLSQPL